MKCFSILLALSLLSFVSAQTTPAPSAQTPAPDAGSTPAPTPAPDAGAATPAPDAGASTPAPVAAATPAPAALCRVGTAEFSADYDCASQNDNCCCTYEDTGITITQCSANTTTCQALGGFCSFTPAPTPPAPSPNTPPTICAVGTTGSYANLDCAALNPSDTCCCSVFFAGSSTTACASPSNCVLLGGTCAAAVPTATATITLSGDISSWGSTEVAALRTQFIAATGIQASQIVTFTVVAGSVVAQAIVAPSSGQSASSLSTSLNTGLSSGAFATAVAGVVTGTTVLNVAATVTVTSGSSSGSGSFVVNSVSPQRIHPGGGATLMINGSGFTGTVVGVLLGDMYTRGCTILSSTQIRCLAPYSGYGYTGDMAVNVAVTIGGNTQTLSNGLVWTCNC